MLKAGCIPATWNFLKTSGSDATVGICFFRLVFWEKKCIMYIFYSLFKTLNGIQRYIFFLIVFLRVLKIKKKKNRYFTIVILRLQKTAWLYDSHVSYNTWTPIVILYFLSNLMIRIAVWKIAFPCLWLILSLYRFKEFDVNQMDIARCFYRKKMLKTIGYFNIRLL